MRGVWWRATSSITTTSASHSAIGYVTPKDKLAGRQPEIHAKKTGKSRRKRGSKFRQAAHRQKRKNHGAPAPRHKVKN